MSFKVAIFNILNKQIVNIFGKIKALQDLFQTSSGTILKKYFAISNKRLDSLRNKRSRGKSRNITHYNHSVCSKHTTRVSCLENQFCKWGDDKDTSLSTYDKFKPILQEEYEFECKKFILSSYYPDEFNEKDLPIRFIRDFYGYNQGFETELRNKYDIRSPEFTKNILIGYDVIRKEAGLKPLFSFKNLLKPEYRKLFKKEPSDSNDLRIIFEKNESANDIYKQFIHNILNTYNESNLLNDKGKKDKKDQDISKINKIRFVYGKENEFMIRVQEEIQKVLGEYERIYIENKLGITQTQTQTQKNVSIAQAIKYIWDNNKKDENFLKSIQNHKLISMSQNIEKSTCKLYLHIDELNYFIKKAFEQIIREPQRRIQILTNTFKTYNPEEPYIKKEHELIFSNEDINKLLQSDISKYELSQFVNNIRFFDITYSNQTYSKLKESYVSGYNGIDLYSKRLDMSKDGFSKNVTFTYFKTINKDKVFLNRGGNKMTSRKLNELKRKIDMINKRENIRFLDSNIQKDVSYEIF